MVGTARPVLYAKVELERRTRICLLLIMEDQLALIVTLS